LDATKKLASPLRHHCLWQWILLRSPANKAMFDSDIKPAVALKPGLNSEIPRARLC
jgi:hypothetical protein